MKLLRAILSLFAGRGECEICGNAGTVSARDSGDDVCLCDAHRPVVPRP